MNEIPVNRELLINSDNDGILKELLAQAKIKSYNSLWGPEYLLMNEKSFIDNNSEKIIEVMIKSRSVTKDPAIRDI